LQTNNQLRTFIEEFNDFETVSSLQNAHIKGMLINQIQEKMYDAQSERQTSIYSPAFYTSATGYKLCIRLYLNGDGTVRGTHISIFLVIFRGQYDVLLQWSFSYRVSFCLCDQRIMIESGETKEAKHIINDTIFIKIYIQ
jgi:hypothetical protein